MSEKEETIERETEAKDILQTIARGYDGIQDPETPAHQVWETVNWLKDSLGDEFGDIVSELKSVDDVAITVIEHDDTQAVEIHHTFAEPLPPEITGPVSSTPSKIRGHESKFDAEDNIVETAIWVVPNAASDDWESPEFRRLSEGSEQTPKIGEETDKLDKVSEEPYQKSSTQGRFGVGHGVNLAGRGAVLHMLLYFIRGQVSGTVPPESLELARQLIQLVSIAATAIMIAGGLMIAVGLARRAAMGAQ